mmetsp:Transcript_47696/g.152890  ORF Transcript_47696/g.152890 Transcript_47696/m.152890 type:complete len:426 (+) Transcript_47696:324-1601(+)
MAAGVPYSPSPSGPLVPLASSGLLWSALNTCQSAACLSWPARLLGDGFDDLQRSQRSLRRNSRVREKRRAFAVHDLPFTTPPTSNMSMNHMMRAFAQQMARRNMAAAAAGPARKVAVLGAAGGIGQPLGLLMKMTPAVTELALFDIVGTPGVAADISHVNTGAKVTGYVGDDQLADALKGADLVIIPAGVPRKPGMTRDDLFNINAGIVKNLIEGVSKHCPGAFINMISNPVNSTVPIAAEVLKKAGVYDPKRLFGVTTLDVVRAKTFYAEKKGLDVKDVDIPVVGGHAGITILPLLSQASPGVALTDEEIDALTKRTQDGGTEVVQAKAGKGSATLSMAYAGALFGDACLRGMNGAPDVVECSYVQSTVTSSVFFSSKVRIGPSGAEEIMGLGSLSAYEQAGLDAMLPQLAGEIEKGVEFVKNN